MINSIKKPKVPGLRPKTNDYIAGEPLEKYIPGQPLKKNNENKMQMTADSQTKEQRTTSYVRDIMLVIAGMSVPAIIWAVKYLFF